MVRHSVLKMVKRSPTDGDVNRWGRRRKKRRRAQRMMALVAFPKIRKSATRNHKTGGASALPFLLPSRAGMLRPRRGKDWSARLAEFDGSEYQKFPPCLAFQVDSLACWMRHPNPFISLLSFMLLFRIRANSHQQPLNDLP